MAADNIYDHLELQTIDDATCEDAEIRTRPTAKETDLQNILQSEIRRHRRIGVRVGLLCAVLVLLNIAVPLYLYQSNKVERDQLMNNYNQVQARNTNLTEDREQKETSFDQLQTRFDQLQTRLNNLTGERDDTLCGELCESRGWQKFDRGCYYISNETKNWDESRQWCRDRQSDLIVIKSKAKQDFVASFNKRIHLGLTDRDREGSFKWVDGTPMTTTYWRTGGPFNSIQKDCVEYYDGSQSGSPSKGWEIQGCSSHYTNWICERALC